MYKSSRQEFLYNNINCNNDNAIIAIVRTVYSGIFNNIQQYSAMFKFTEGIKGYLVIFRNYCGVWCCTQTYLEICVTFIHTTPAYLESSKTCQICKIIRYISYIIIRDLPCSFWKSKKSSWFLKEKS